MKKAIKVISDVLVAVILVISIVMTVLVITSLQNDDHIPNLFGYAMLNVKTDSMVSEEGFDPGSLILVKTLTEEETENLKVGDVITYRRVYNGAYYLDTHRIVEITQNIVDANVGRSNLLMNEVVDGVWVHGGVRYYVTKGDNAEGIDYQESGDLEFAHSGNIVGVWTGKQIPMLGSAIEFLRSQTGFFCCIVLPLLIFFLYQLIHFITTFSAKKKAEALEAVSASEEEIKQKAVEEFLAKQAAEQKAAENAENVPSTEETEEKTE